MDFAIPVTDTSPTPTHGHTAQSKPTGNVTILLASVVLLGAAAGAALGLHANEGVSVTQAFPQAVGQTVHWYPRSAITVVSPLQPTPSSAAIPQAEGPGHPPHRTPTRHPALRAPADEGAASLLEPALEQETHPNVAHTALVAAAATLTLTALYRMRHKRRRPGFVEFASDTRVALSYVTGRRTERRPTAVYNVFERAARLVRSWVTAVLQELEDPEKVMAKWACFKGRGDGA